MLEPNLALKPRRRFQQLELRVAEVIAETADTTTIVFAPTGERPAYRAGQFLTIDPHQFPSLARFIAFFEGLKGRREPPRAYSLSSAPHEPQLSITVKEERFVPGLTRYPPLLSPLLVRRLRPGCTVLVSGFGGPYTLPDDVESRTGHLVHVCAGSGVVPNFAILKHALTRHPRLRHTLVCSNKTWDEVIFRDALERIACTQGDRVRLIHTLTREAGPEGTRAGRIDAALLRHAIPDPSTCLVYACGPAITPQDRASARELGVAPAPRFLETAVEALRDAGVDEARITRESYG